MSEVVVRDAVPHGSTTIRTLGRLLGEYQAARAEPEITGPNHLPMTLIALDRLGAPPETLGAYADMHRQDSGQLPPPVSPGRIARENWRGALGDPLMEQAYRAFFETELIRLGRGAMLREYLPDLMEGCGGAGFHPMIRLAFGLRHDDDSEIVLALAYWATAFLALGHSQHNRPGQLDPRGVLERLRRDHGAVFDGREVPLEDGMAIVREMPSFRAVLHWLKSDERTLSDIAEASLALFIAANNEKALHLLAATHALRTLLPWFYDPMPAFKYFWQAVGAAYLVMNSLPLPSSEALSAAAAESSPAWPVLRQAAIESMDDHIIQAVYSCGEEEVATGNRLYRTAAARYVARHY